ncbi:MAG TPA: WG repeat-containing protein [Blastocatellia bacterium]|nr:WG repeat-containing protein [Blastocatellia bacterium]
MQHRAPITIASITAISFAICSLVQGSVTHGAKQKPKSNVTTGSAGSLEKNPDALNGEWRVRCTEKIYRNGTLLTSSQDSNDSLIVVETDYDGSYQLYRFPNGFGEALPRLRRVVSNQYEGQDTVNGITTVVKQDVEIQNEKITIKQLTIDAPSKQPETDIACEGARLQSTLRFPASLTDTPSCPANPTDGERPDKKIASQYKTVMPFSDGLAAVSQVPNGDSILKWGFIDKNGKVVISLNYDVVTSFHDGLAVVGKSYGTGRNLKWGVIEKLGPQVTPNVHYDGAKNLGEGFAAVGYARPQRKGLKWNLINRENTTILHGFDDFGCFVNGRARASYTEGGVVRRGFINKVGDFVASDK